METLFGTKLNPLNISEAARLTGYSRSTISRWKNHPESMTVQALRVLSEAMGVTDDAIINTVREKHD